MQEEPDLLIFEADHPSKLCRELSGWKENDLETGHPDLLILPPEPTLPIKKLLVVLPDNGSGCEKAGSWIIRLSQSRRIDVTILPVLPPIPLCYGTFLRHNLAALLAGSDDLGKNLRLLSSRISRENVTANYKLREGEAINQIRNEISTLDPDLIIMPSGPQQGWASWFCSDLAGVLFKWMTKPILILNQN